MQYCFFDCVFRIQFETGYIRNSYCILTMDFKNDSLSRTTTNVLMLLQDVTLT